MERSTLRRGSELLARVRLSTDDGQGKKFSKGMTRAWSSRRARSRSEVLLLDEPTDASIPWAAGRSATSSARKRPRARDSANSHLLSEIELTATGSGPAQGKVAAGAHRDLTAQGSRYRMAVSPVDEPLLAAFRASGAGVER